MLRQTTGQSKKIIVLKNPVSANQFPWFLFPISSHFHAATICHFIIHAGITSHCQAKGLFYTILMGDQNQAFWPVLIGNLWDDLGVSERRERERNRERQRERWWWWCIPLARLRELSSTISAVSIEPYPSNIGSLLKHASCSCAVYTKAVGK